MQYELKGKHICLNFVSRSKWNRKLATMFRVYWKTDKSRSYVENIDS